LPKPKRHPLTFYSSVVVRRPKGGRAEAAGPGDPATAADKGERWGTMSVDRASRLVVAWASGPRDEALAEKIVTATRDRTGRSATLTYVTDGWEAYESAVKRAYWEREVYAENPNWAILRPTEKVRLTQAIKHRKGRRLARVEVRATIGEPNPQPYAVHLERLNGTLRDRLGCLTRKTHAFAKGVATWDALFGLALFAHNWLRPHVALRRPLAEPIDDRRYERRTPAMALALTDRVWSWEEFLRLPAKQRQS
jgi:IS1 family transposase